MSSSSSPPSSLTNRYNRKKLVLVNGGRMRFPPPGSSRPVNKSNTQGSSAHSVALQNLLKLNQLVDILKSLKRLISHYFDQISKQGESILAGDVRRVYRRILLLYVKYRRRQNYEKRHMKQTTDESDDDDEEHPTESNTNNHSNEMNNTPMSPTWTMKKTVSSQSLPFTRAGFNADQDGVEDFDEIALAATRDVANVQNHCVRSILDDHQMKLSVYGLQTRWDSEIPKQRKHNQSTTSAATITTTSSMNRRVQVVKRTGIKSSNVSPLATSAPSVSSISTVISPSTSDQELFLGSLARQLNDQAWQQLRSILANCNSQSSATTSQEQIHQ